MNQFTIKQTIALLARVANRSIQDFYYFPDVILAGKQRLEKDEFGFLLTEGYIHEYKVDSFGKFYKLSKKAEEIMYTTVMPKPMAAKKKLKVSHMQGCLNFAC